MEAIVTHKDSLVDCKHDKPQSDEAKSETQEVDGKADQEGPKDNLARGGWGGRGWRDTVANY